MPDTIHKQILDEVHARFAGITAINGYHTTVEKLERGRLKPFVPGDLPALTYWFAEDTRVDAGAGFELREVPLFAEYHDTTREVPFPDFSAELSSDMWIALWRDTAAPAVSDNPSSHLGGMLDAMWLQQITPEIGSGQAPWVGALIEVRMRYRRRPNDPYTIIN